MTRQAAQITTAADTFALADEIIKNAEADKAKARAVLLASGRDVVYTTDGRAITRRDASRSTCDLKAARQDAKIDAALRAYDGSTAYVTFSVSKGRPEAEA